jgi:hypothetical protein
MDDEDFSRYFTDQAEQSNYNQPSYPSSFGDPESANIVSADQMNQNAAQDDADAQAKALAEYFASQQSTQGNDQSFGFLPPQELTQAEKDAIAREEASPGGTADTPFDKKNLTGGISGAYKALQEANKKAGPNQLSKKDMLSMLMPMLLAMIAKQQGGGSGMSAAQQATQPKIPSLTAQREMTPYTAPGEKGYTRPGAGGKTYFSDVQYKAGGGEIQSQPFNPGQTNYKNPYSPPDPAPVVMPTTYKAAGGGIGDLGGYSDGGRLLKGPGDGVSDSIPAKIGQDRPARLSDGEFVIPARIVSELGNGSTEAGAKKLYAMMDRVKKARNHKNIAANTKADKYLPA